MRPYLVFTLQAPLASFGTIAVGERRPTWDRPSKSQVIGFLAAALGIERADEARQSALAASIGFAVRVDDPGYLLQDYHTAQRAEDAAVRRRLRAGHPVATRRDELEADDIRTILSRREYRRDAAYTIALWIDGEDVVSLRALAEAIRAPAFHLAAGRKAATLMFPCSPVVTPPEPDVVAALATFDAADAELRAFRENWTPARLTEKRNTGWRTLYADETVELPSSVCTTRFEDRRDVPLTRKGWRFTRRTERVVPLPQSAEYRT
jgi:CRISPR system Cascade subunit CasD